MIVNSVSGGEVKTSSNIESKELRIKASGKAFRAMLDGIYKDKPGSIVRELYTNGLDGQRVAGNVKRPLVIHLPNIYEPHFSIRDFGCSMNPTQIENVYGVLFESSKDQSNDQAGGFGLGGKNFLSYQDSGTIICYLDGIKYDYVLMYGPDGTPRIYPMGTSETTEENGVYVELAIKDGDYYKFNAAVEKQLRWLNVVPVLNNNSGNTEIHQPQYQNTYGRFKTFTQDYNNPRGFWIVQGEIGYPLNINELEQHMKNKNALEFFKAYDDGALFFDIGEISVTLGREDIQYDNHTIASIEKFIGEVAPIISKKVIDDVEKFPTLWEKMSYLNTDPSLFCISRLAGIDLTKDNNKGKANIYHGNNRWVLDVSFLSKKDNENNFAFCEYKSNKRNYFDSNGIVLHPNDKIRIFIRDIGRGAIARMKYNEMNNSSYRTYMIEHRLGYEHITQKMIDDLIERFAGLEIKCISSLAEPPKNVMARNGSPLVYSWDEGDAFDKVTKWSRIYDEEELEHGLYLTFDVYPQLNISYDMIGLIHRLIEDKFFKINKTPIYAVKTSRLEIFENNVNFVKLEDKISEIVNDINKKYSNNQTLMRYIKARNVKDSIKEILQHLPVSSIENKHLTPILKNKSSYLNRLLRLHTLVLYYIDKVEKSDLLKKMSSIEKYLVMNKIANEMVGTKIPNLKLPDLDKITKRYPLFPWINNGWYSDKTDRATAVIQYINLIDSNLTAKKK